MYALELTLGANGIHLLSESAFTYYTALFCIQTLLLSLIIFIARYLWRSRVAE